MAATEPDDQLRRLLAGRHGDVGDGDPAETFRGLGEQLSSSPAIKEARDRLAIFSEPEPIGPPSFGLAGDFRIDPDAQAQIFRELETQHDEKLAREQKVIDTLEAVHAELIASAKREADALKRANDAETRNRSILWLTAAGVAVAVLALAVAVIALFVR